SGASERANYQLFLSELCELLGVEKPRPASDKVHEASYTFERPVEFDDGEGKKTTNFIDLYKQHCFVLEAKQGSDRAAVSEAEVLGSAKAKTKTGTAIRDTRTWEREMKSAKEQALRYARALPVSEGWPPFLVVVDVGFCIDLYSDFTRQGKTYIPFPDPLNYRIQLVDLEKKEIQERLRFLFTDPLELDPSKRAAKVTRELAERLAKLAALLEKSGNSPEKVAGFLMRCLFTMFAEDVHLLPERSFTKLLQDYKQNLDLVPKALQSLWMSMDKGGFDPALRILIPQFNGFLYKDHEALPLSEAQLDLLILASEADWADVEPAIFGTLLERALQPRERHKLGAHYTPRAYVERLVMPTVIEPLREDWEAARTASAILEKNGDESGALKEIMKFQRRLCSVRVLDPACGSGNFLYVTLEHLKRLEGEVVEYIAHFPRQLGLDMTGGYTVTPAQLLGLEVNPRAAAIADVVLWIGYLQWHFRTHGHAKRLEDPILRQYGNIIQRDAVLNYTEKKPRLDNEGKPVTRWDGYTTKTHPVTGLEVPDETARTPVYSYINPKPATWPEADFIVGNPPFIGAKYIRETLGDGYAEALRKAYQEYVQESADFVMFWWFKAAKLLSEGKAESFGFITTNSIWQIFNRRVLEIYIDSKTPISIVFAIPNHPWVNSADGANVEIAMTMAQKGTKIGRLLTILSEEKTDSLEVQVNFAETRGIIHPDLTIGAATTSAIPLEANDRICSRGVQLIGAGFILEQEQAEIIGYRNNISLNNCIKPYRNGKDFAGLPRHVFVIDLFGLSEKEVRFQYPEIYQWILERVKPERDHNPRVSYKNNWWLHGEQRIELRKALDGLQRYITTPATAKHRVFQFYEIKILPDDALINVASDDAFILGVLSSKIHGCWALATGGDLGGNTPRYNNSRCFQTFPFPDVDEEQKKEIRSIAEQLDAHRKQRQSVYSTLTITDMYNVLEKLRSGKILDIKEKKIHEEGLVSVLLQLHNELDAAVTISYNFPLNLKEEEILEKLVAINKERASEEASGLIRWLRPEYQNMRGSSQTGLNINTVEAEISSNAASLSEWPRTLSEQAKAVHRIIQQSRNPISASNINKQFRKTQKNVSASREQQIEHLLETISTLGLARKTNDGSFVK
ncbi:MAG TPA: DNA methyltransferase, partial [Puia sp.]|nr:DNA methyltransferase [Puia sp.]